MSVSVSLNIGRFGLEGVRLSDIQMPEDVVRDTYLVELPEHSAPADSDLAQEMTRDPYSFAFTGITGKYNEALLNLN